MNKHNISLIGFMGTGKTTIGKILAEKMGYDFVDVDEFIVKSEGRSINDIFIEEGEEYFRDIETNALHKILEGKNQVISTGGGLVLREENRRALLEGSFVVALKASPRNIYFRLKDCDERPLLKGAHPEKTIRTLLHKRYQFYNKNHMSVATDKLSVDEVVEIIIKEINK
ncbi:shikimate kinase [Alkalibacter saccharofermentans]|uniref:Shikimate kinase n=1 Tax=Alkalibacter saccharofermentans DSM 14828 TaxID=1120975 RepID=A0A1M4S987_9FIRM|nr:shikimate kinase [Alkalibacter saccharofermentans]SHE28725.1 shikimate kinase [Alkalibacter saccharofermentans DSM 14828]